MIRITARHEQGHIVITVEDDGQGIDLEKVKNKAVEKGFITAAEAAAMSEEQATDLIFSSGLSTAKTVTDISGRGVGMDIVRNNIEHLNGSVQVETWPGRGTQFQIILPLTLAIVPTLLVQVGMIKFAIPLGAITQTLRIPVDTIKTVNQKPVITLRGSVLPVAHLGEIFNFSSQSSHADHVYVVVVRWGKANLGIIVDKLIGEQELVVKSLSSLLGDTPGIASAAILGDGQVSLIVDVKGLFSLAGVHQHRH
jgi:two-component system chemotaxis sensor kinase CheA